MHSARSNHARLTTRELTTLSMYGALLYVSKLALSFLPNIHLLGVMIVAATVVYRGKALYAIYLYIFIEGLLAGFSLWWIPYLYVWAVLWGAVMLLPRQMPKKAAAVVYPLVCGLHGLLFGTLYAPAQALLFGLDFQGMIAWIIAGLPWDCIHGVSNFVCGFLILPLIHILRKLQVTAN